MLQLFLHLHVKLLTYIAIVTYPATQNISDKKNYEYINP